MLTFICYPKCTTCQKAKTLLDSHGASYETRDIKTDSPTYDELKSWCASSGLPVKKFVNTSGLQYKALGLKDKLPTMIEDDCLRLLATDGMLVKRPLLIIGGTVLAGFNHDGWEAALTKASSAPETVSETVTVDVTDNDINLPMEWCMGLGLSISFVQITLVDDRIAIHNPTAVGVEYTKPCRAGEHSYIRHMGLYNVRVPKQFLEALGIQSGGKADVTREENCISIRKRPDEPAAPQSELPEPPEPRLAFCCVCGRFHYTGQGVVKVLSKYICHDCIEAVKAL